MNVKPLFKLMVEKKASDLFFAPYAPAKIKIEGKIIPVNKLEMTPKMVKQAAFELMDENLLETFARDLEVDFAISESGLGRFRVNVFHQRGNVAMVLRYITSEMPRLDDLDMPEQLKELVMLRRGLVLMVGASGNGKSTTLAAMINHRNEKTSSHIITIEDPIEFLHPNKQSIVNQREVGLDTKSYATALKSAMRSAPDDPAAWFDALRAAGYTHVVVNPIMLDVWEGSGWNDPLITSRRVQDALAAHATLEPATLPGDLSLHRLNRGRSLPDAAAPGRGSPAPAAP